VTFGLPEDYYDTYRANITAVTTRDVHEAAKTHVRPDELQVVVVGNADLIREPVEALGIGRLEVGEPKES
jgi:predicted Zn-dependent peptidase